MYYGGAGLCGTHFYNLDSGQPLACIPTMGEGATMIIIDNYKGSKRPVKERTYPGPVLSKK